MTLIDAPDTEPNDATAQRQTLRDGILNVGLKLGAGYAASGNPYTWMIDTRELLLTRPYLQIVGAMLWQRLKPYGPTHVGGMTLAANPLTAAVLYEAWADGYQLDGFLIRKTPKENGLRKIIEGPKMGPNARLVLVDDMINSGTTQRQAFRHLGPLKNQILAVGTVLDSERMGRAWLKGQNIDVEALFTLEELGLIPTDPATPDAASVAWRWKYLNGGTHSAPHSTPWITSDRLVVGSDKGFVVCLDLDGQELWRFTARMSRNGIHSSPVVRNNCVWIGSYDGFMYCLNLATGELIWEQRVGQWIGSSPTLDFSGSRVFVGIEYGEGGGSLIALDANSGESMWEKRLGQYVHSSPFYSAERDCVFVGCNDGNLYALDAATGAQHWCFCAGREIKAGPVVDDNQTCFFTALTGNIYAVDASTGIERWSKRLGRSAYFRPLISGSLVIAAGASGRVLALDRGSGRVVWAGATGSAIVGGAARTIEGDILVGSRDGSLYLFEGATGALLWTVRTGDAITAEPRIANDSAAIPSRDGSLYFIRFVAKNGIRQERD